MRGVYRWKEPGWRRAGDSAHQRLTLFSSAPSLPVPIAQLTKCNHALVASLYEIQLRTRMAASWAPRGYSFRLGLIGDRRNDARRA